MDLSGTVKTPLGNVQKKTALMIGGGLVLIVGIIWYRQKKNDKSAAGANTGINPATGYAYGSEEDAAALANQAAYVTPTGSGGGGGGGGSGNAGFVSNAQWTQATISGMMAAGIIEDSTLLSAALGKYIAGQPAGDLRSLIEQAIAFSGYPPVAAANGYPPAINTENPVNNNPPPNTTPNPNPTPTPTPVARPASLVAPANTNLYDWSQSVENQYGIHEYMVITRCEETGKVRWRPTSNPNGEPQFDAPTTVRLG